jgi:hypothetical protein
MRESPASISLAALTPSALACDLCPTPGGTVDTVVIIRHPHGGQVEFSACERCVTTLRRVAAAAGEFAQFVLNPVPVVARPAVASPAVASPAVASSVVTRPIVISEPSPVTVAVETLHEFATLLRDTDGTDYRARACGGQRPDGSWIGWLEFHPVSGGLVWRTDRETTQPDHAALTYWASGLEPHYLEGAFSRARSLGKAV